MVFDTFNGNPYTTIISSYNSSNGSEKTDIIAFYNELSFISWHIPKTTSKSSVKK